MKQPIPAPFARVADAYGKVEKKLPGGSAYQPLSVGDRLPVAATLRTGEGAILVELPDRHVVRVGARTTVVLSQLGQDKQFALKVLAGQVWTLVKKANHPSKFTVETSSGIAGVTGTFFGVAVDEETQETVVSTGEGSVQVQSLDEQGQPLGEPVPVTQGMMTRLVRRQRTLAALRQGQEHRQMWQLLYREGAWAQQGGKGPLHMKRGDDAHLMKLLHAHPPKALWRPGRPPYPVKRR